MMTWEQWKLIILVEVLVLALDSPCCTTMLVNSLLVSPHIALITSDVISFVPRIGETAIQRHAGTGSCTNAGSFWNSIQA
jgi:hypothetical protein